MSRHLIRLPQTQTQIQTPSLRLLSTRPKKPPKPTSDADADADPPFTPIPTAPRPPAPLSFDFRYSYSETDPSVRPISFREPPRFSPFGPGRLDRSWDGVSAPVKEEVDAEALLKERSRVLGNPLTDEEVEDLVERYRHNDCARQINLAFTQDKTGGKIIYRKVNILLLYRGRNYDTKERPFIPRMLWKPYAPIYPKLIKNVADGLTFEETKELRGRGLNTPPLLQLRFGALCTPLIFKGSGYTLERKREPRFNCM